MDSRRNSVVLRIALAVALLPAPAGPGHATGGNGPRNGTWGPDVAARVAELRQRWEQASAEARERRDDEARRGWHSRLVAAAPPLERR